MRTMFSWLRPLRTSISPQTAASFPLTFFLGMILIATSLTSPESSIFFEPLEIPDEFEFLRMPKEMGGDEGEPRVSGFLISGDPFPVMVLIILAGTRHLAACSEGASGRFALAYKAQPNTNGNAP